MRWGSSTISCLVSFDYLYFVITLINLVENKWHTYNTGQKSRLIVHVYVFNVKVVFEKRNIFTSLCLSD